MTKRNQRIWEVGAFALMTVLYIIFNRYKFLEGPTREFTWKVLTVLDPGLFKHDVLATLSNDAYYTFLAWPLAFLNRWFSLYSIYFVGHCMSTFFYLYFVYRIGKNLF